MVLNSLQLVLTPNLAPFNASHRMDLASWISSVLDTINTRENGKESGGGLPHLVGHCHTYSGIGVGWNFMTMVSRLQLAVNCLRYVFGMLWCHSCSCNKFHLKYDMIAPVDFYNNGILRRYDK